MLPVGGLTRAVIRLLHLPFEDIANGTGVSYDTVKGWSYGRSDPSPENRIALARFMREHAGSLVEAAEELER